VRFQLIDRVVASQPDRLVAVKAVTAAEEYLADHFPDFPVLPGVLMLEALVEAGRRLVAPQADGQRLLPLNVRNVRYGAFVRPGSLLELEVQLRKAEESGWECSGVGRVGDEVAVQGRFRLSPLPGRPPSGA
jgi:3-hydroxyacyl-[acyl-carrier-protein] dehydratase